MLLKTKLSNHLCRYAKNTGGQFAILFALCSTVLVGGLAVSVDVSSAHKLKTELQDVSDAIALMAMKTDVTNTGELNQLANDYLSDHYASSANDIQILSITNDGGRAAVDLQRVMPTAFGSILGKDNLTIGASSTVSQTFQNLDLALVLDNTGSMSGRKIRALKQASNDLVDILYAEAEARKVTQIGLVPFSAWVNVGKDNFDPSWIDTRGRSPQNGTYFDRDVSRFELYSEMDVQWDGCVENRLPPYDVDDTAPNTSRPETLFQPAFHPDMADNDPGGHSYAADTVGGSMIARMRDTNKYFGGVNGRGATERSDGSCDARREVTPLTNNEQQIRRGIRNMYASGWTNIANGASWGFRLISPNAPFTEGRAYGEKSTTKAMVILTDGMQTMGGRRGAFKSAYSPFGFLGEPAVNGTKRLEGGNAKEALDRKLTETCEAAKAKNIVVYTITFELNDVDTQNIMRGCASDSSKYFDVTSSAELAPAFKQIAGNLTEIRVAN